MCVLSMIISIDHLRHPWLAWLSDVGDQVGGREFLLCVSALSWRSDTRQARSGKSPAGKRSLFMLSLGWPVMPSSILWVVPGPSSCMWVILNFPRSPAMVGIRFHPAIPPAPSPSPRCWRYDSPSSVGACSASRWRFPRAGSSGGHISDRHHRRCRPWRADRRCRRSSGMNGARH